MAETSQLLLWEAVKVMLQNAARQRPSLYTSRDDLVVVGGGPGDFGGDATEPVDPAWLCADYRKRMEELEADARLAKLYARVASLRRDLRCLADDLFPVRARSDACQRVLFARSETNLCHALASALDLMGRFTLLVPGHPLEEGGVTVLSQENLADLDAELARWNELRAAAPPKKCFHPRFVAAALAVLAVVAGQSIQRRRRQRA